MILVALDNFTIYWQNILIWLNNHFKISTVIVIHLFLQHGLENISVSEIIFLNGSDG